MSAPRAYTDVMQELRSRFIQRTIQQREQLKTLAAAGIAPANLPEILHICHNLHGTAGVFDLAEIGDIAHQAEDLGKILGQTQPPALDPRWKELAVVIDNLCDLIAALPPRDLPDQA